MFKYLVSEVVNPYYNLAKEQLLMEQCENDCILFLWQNSNTIVIGRNQIAEVECRAQEFKANGGLIARRRSGGGAVFHDLGNLNFSLICKEKYKEQYKYQEIVSNALMCLGVSCGYNGRNDLLIGDRKFSGNAFYIEKEVLCQHGTILVNCDIDKMTYYLTPQIDKLKRNHVKSVRSRVVNLSEIISSISIKDVVRAMIKATNAEIMCDKYSENDIKNMSSLYKSYDWLIGGKR